jgi:hypothetical protein
MSNVRALKGKFVTPAMVIESLEKHKIDALYCVAFVDGAPMIWASGDLGQLCHAAIVFQDYATRFSCGEIEEE